MAVYVDDMRAKFRQMVMCHMTADTLDELHAMADRIGLSRKCFQCPPRSSHPHYDVCLSKRAAALRFGAIEVTQRAGLYFAAKLGVEWAGSIEDQRRRALVRLNYRRTMGRVERYAEGLIAA